MVVGGGRESDYSVCPCLLLQFFQFMFQFTLEERDVELDNYIKLRMIYKCKRLIQSLFIDNFGFVSYSNLP